MGVMSISGLSMSGGGFSSHWFSDRSAHGEQFHAVVLWRQKTAAGRITMRRTRFPRLRFLFTLVFIATGILPRLWPRGFRAWMHGSFKEADAARAEMMRPPDPDEERWSSSSGRGKDLIGFDKRRRVVGFRGRIFGPAPEGRMLLVMMEDDESAPDGIRIVERAVPMPTMPEVPRIDRSMSKDEKSKAAMARHRLQHEAMDAVLRTDPEYERFMQS
jgi:hypothetical protein